MEGRRQAYWCLLSTDRVSGQAAPRPRTGLLSRKRSEGMGQCFEVLRLAAAFCKGADASCYVLCPRFGSPRAILRPISDGETIFRAVRWTAAPEPAASRTSPSKW